MSIPKKIHYVWLGDVPLPESDQKYIEGWQKMNPGFAIHHWSEKNVDITKYPLVQKALDEKRWALAADVIRMIVMYDEGGIYLDTDIELLKPLDTEIALPDGVKKLTDFNAFACWESDFWFTTAAFGAKAHSPWIEKILKRYELADIEQKISTDTFLKTVHSPSVYAKDIFGLELDGQTRNYNDDLLTLASDYFCPKHYMTGELHVTENTIAVHHYASTWHTKVEKLKNELAKESYKTLGAEKYKFFEKRYNARLEKEIRKELP